MNNIFISWWWDANQSKLFDKLFKEQLLWKRILYIPWAFYSQRYNNCLNWIYNIFPKSDWYNVKILNENEQINIDLLINNYDWIYIWWWNTFRLLKLIRNTWFDKVINKFIKIEKPIYWWSAWAIIMWKEIHTSPDLNVEKLNFEDSLWLNLFKWYSIFCHYKDEYDSEIYDYVKNYNIPVICLKEGVWAYIKNNLIYIAGIDSAYILNKKGKKEIKIGEYI